MISLGQGFSIQENWQCLNTFLVNTTVVGYYGPPCIITSHSPLSVGETFDLFLIRNMAKVMGYHSHDCFSSHTTPMLAMECVRVSLSLLLTLKKQAGMM